MCAPRLAGTQVNVYPAYCLPKVSWERRNRTFVPLHCEADVFDFISRIHPLILNSWFSFFLERVVAKSLYSVLICFTQPSQLN